VAAASLEDRIAELREDRSHGASWMARQAVEALTELAEQHEGSGEALLDDLRRAGRQLAAARPGVGAIAGAVGRMLASGRYESHLEPDDLRRVFCEEAQALTDGRIRAPASIAIQLRERIDGATVLTHSNSATVREAFSHDEPKKVLCTVSNPVEEGRTLGAELIEAGIDAELLEDADAPDRVKETDVVLLGADTVFRDGTICNKIGTIPLALAARDAGVPVVVAAELIKLAPVPGAQAPDLADFERELFELIPADLITEVVTEEGTFAPDDLASLVDRVPFLREGYELVAPLAANR
jgi:ribose 1,5-bisphosphate isomerase